MEKKIITGNEPANAVGAWGQQTTTGLTIREHFASLAMQGLCANYLRENVTGWHIETYATEAVAIADALIKELNK